MKAVEFAREVFGAALVGEPLMRADGSLWNAEVKIGDSTVMFTDSQGGPAMPAFVCAHAPDADAVCEKALGALDAPTGFRLEEHIFVAHKGDYYDIADGLLQKATE